MGICQLFCIIRKCAWWLRRFVAWSRWWLRLPVWMSGCVPLRFVAFRSVFAPPYSQHSTVLNRKCCDQCTLFSACYHYYHYHINSVLCLQCGSQIAQAKHHHHHHNHSTADTNTENQARPSMKFTATLSFLLMLALVAMQAENVSAQRCEGTDKKKDFKGLCTPEFVCPKGTDFDKPNKGCPKGTGCCNKGAFRCKVGNKRGFIVPRKFCKKSDDLGDASPDAPKFLRCCKKNIPK